MEIIKKVILYLINLFFTGFIPFLIFAYLSEIYYTKDIYHINFFGIDISKLKEIKVIIAIFIMSFVVKYVIKICVTSIKEGYILFCEGGIFTKIYFIMGILFTGYRLFLLFN
ncbi:MAG: hypothetical protein ACRCRV_04040 [Cetobacterium sp.]